MAEKMRTIGTFIIAEKEGADFLCAGDPKKVAEVLAERSYEGAVNTYKFRIPTDLSDLWDVLRALDVVTAFEVRLFMIELVEFGMELERSKQPRV